ncbi:MAG: hypothetical protein AAFV53_32915 [Myxococcota bacterium]
MTSAAPVSSPTGEGAFAEELAAVDAALTAESRRADASPTSWTARAGVSALWRSRARLSGDDADYAMSDAALDEAFSVAVEGAGPFLERASLNATLHRFPQVAPDLDAASAAVLVDDGTAAAIATRRGELAWQQGDYDDAFAWIDASRTLDDTVGGAATAAFFAWRVGDFEAAEALYDEAEAQYHGTAAEPRAWVHLQRGLMDLERGQYEASLAHYLDADAELSGYWLIHEHVAEILVLQGEDAVAQAMYEEIVEATGAPEFMDALAELAQARGDDAEAQQWIDRASAAYEAQLAQFPEAAAGHALGHYLTFGPAEDAVALATANLTLRDNSESRMWMAQALLSMGDVASARAEIEVALSDVWVTAELHATAAEIYTALGEDDAAAAQARAARAIDPRVFD